MTDKEILIAKLTIFLKKYGVYEEYIAGLAEHGCNGKTIDEIAEWCINCEAKNFIIDHSFYWDFVPLMNNQTSWGYLHSITTRCLMKK